MRKRRNPRVCKHRSTITTITAGLAREVCESCARVRLRYVEAAVQMHPEVESTVTAQDEGQAFEATIIFEKISRRIQCRLCAQSAAYLVPDGLVCDEHAWQAAARINWERSDLWVPIPIARGRSPQR